MKTHTIKRGIPFMLLIISICIPNSLLARRLSLNPMDEAGEWEHVNITHSFPSGFHYIEQAAWIYNTAWKRSRSRGRPWIPNPTAVFAATVLQSDDKQCELYSPIIPDNVGFYAKDSLSYARNSWWRFYNQRNLAHRDVMIRYISEFKGQADFRFEDYVTVIGGKMPREYFNADSVFFWNFPIEPTEQEGEIYTECIFMYIWNKEQWVGLTFAWFFTDKGKEQKWSYIDKLKGRVWYNAPLDSTEVSSPSAFPVPFNRLKRIYKQDTP